MLARLSRRRFSMPGVRAGQLPVMLLMVLAVIGLPIDLSHADSPRQDIEIVVPTRAGGTLDLLARTTARHYEANGFGNVRVNNIEGVSGERALAFVLDTAHPNSTWLLAQESLITINPQVHGRDGTGIGTDLHATSSLAESHFYLLVREDDSIESLEELINTLADAEGGIAYGSGGIGTLHHLSMEDLGERLSLPLRHIPYSSNRGAVQGLMSGDVRLVMAGTSALGLVESGDLRMLAVSAPARMAAFPEVPALGEVVPGYAARNWFGIYTPMAMEEQLRTTTRQRLQTIIDTPSFQETLAERAHISTLDLSPDAFRQLIEEEAARFERLLERLDSPRE